MTDKEDPIIVKGDDEDLFRLDRERALQLMAEQRSEWQVPIIGDTDDLRRILANWGIGDSNGQKED